MDVRSGSCLCGTVRFQVEGKIRGVGQCHCGQCRKSTGTNGTMVFLIPKERFKWTDGEADIHTFQLRETYSAVRCGQCGSPVPASYDGNHFWVPPGLMDDDLNAAVALHHHVGSKADWDDIPEHLPHYEGYPPMDAMFTFD